ncbi:hypothetical protein KM043_013000 [Ampulex compressa]|nr:hypothetical protein KM043_013000 [Ampulex compressa]
MRELILGNNGIFEIFRTRKNKCNSTGGYHHSSNQHISEAVDLRKLINDKIVKNKVFYSLELFSAENHHAIYERFFMEMNKYSPLFYALTWHTKNVHDNYLPLHLIEMFPRNTLLHLAAKGLTYSDVNIILSKALLIGIKNIFVLQGESTSVNGDFLYAADLVTFIRSTFGNTFCICVAGYSQMHSQSPSKDMDLFYLKAKVDAGADFIITQIIFESDEFINFVKDCRNVGIIIPIIPGIFPIPDIECLKKMANICKITVPNNILHSLEKIKDDDEATYNYSVELTVNLITDILKTGITHGFHLFTLNKTSLAVKICKRLGLPSQNSLEMLKHVK